MTFSVLHSTALSLAVLFAAFIWVDPALANDRCPDTHYPCGTDSCCSK